MNRAGAGTLSARPAPDGVGIVVTAFAEAADSAAAVNPPPIISRLLASIPSPVGSRHAMSPTTVIDHVSAEFFYKPPAGMPPPPSMFGVTVNSPPESAAICVAPNLSRHWSERPDRRCPEDRRRAQLIWPV
ncbi:hypothetical protein AB5I41_27530 [Sphingomonas sp. MMS24-JH45]